MKTLKIINPSAHAQDYGISTLGAAPKDFKRHARKMAVAAGIGLRLGCSSTFAIEWTLGAQARLRSSTLKVNKEHGTIGASTDLKE